MPPCRAVGASVRPFKIYRELEVLRNRGDHCLTVVPVELPLKSLSSLAAGIQTSPSGMLKFSCRFLIYDMFTISS